jgi:Dockerin type I domain
MMLLGRWGKAAWLTLAIGFCVGCVNSARAGLYINEIFIDPPGNESQREYVELRGDTPGMSLANHWLVVLENEGNLEPTMSEVGSIDTAIDLSAFSLGSNGFLVMRRAGNPYSINSSSADVELPPTQFENSGGTFLLIDKGTGPTPTAGMKLDGMVDNDGLESTVFDGLDYPNEGQPGWSIVDSIGVAVEVEEVGLGRLYAPINFGPEANGHVFDPDLGGTFNTADHIEPDAKYVSTGFEIEVIARYGDSSGQDEHDWHMTNVTDNGLAHASASTGVFAQAGTDPHGFPREPFSEAQYGVNPVCDYACYLAGYHESESSQFVPYGTPITTTLGGANYPLNQTTLPWDYNHDGVVDAADYTVWRNTLGQSDPNPENNPLAANSNRNGSVDLKDYAAWKYHFGESLPMSEGAGSLAAAGAPEPASFLLALSGVLAFSAFRLRTR